MTFRALLIGMIGALFIAGFGFINDRVFELESFNSGHLLPVIVLGGLVFVLALVNPILFRIHRGLVFRPAEAAVVIGMMMVACSIPGRGLMEQFTQTIATPAHWYEQRPGWKRKDLFKYVPPSVYIADGKYDHATINDYLSGCGKPGEPISLGRVPWAKWKRSLGTWLPLLFLSAAASICLALILHRQWSDHERLRYPIADFATTLLRRESHEAVSAIFRNKMFWIGLGIVLAIRVTNGINVWSDRKFIEIPMTLDFSALRNKFPLLNRTGHSGYAFVWVNIYPVVIGFSYFLASEISLTLGLSQVVFMIGWLICLTAGITLQSDYELGGLEGWLRSGSYISMGLMLLYIGRRYYWEVFKAGVTFRRGRATDQAAIWAFRILLVCTAALIYLVTHLGLDWTLSIILILLVLLTFVIVARIGAETGLFFIQPGLQPCGIMLGFFGSYALGPQAIMLTCLICMVLCADQSQALMPYVTNIFRFSDNVGLRPGRVGGVSMATYILGVGVAVPAVIWACYNWGCPRYGYARERIPTVPFRAADPAVAELNRSSELSASERLSPIRRLIEFRPKEGFMAAAGIGFALVLIFSFLRLRFTWWPIHPVMFLVWGSYPIRMFSHSFLIGWLVKLIVTRFGGHRTYQKVKPFMIGLIAAELLSGIIFMAVGAIYYSVTGTKPVPYIFFPR